MPWRAAASMRLSSAWPRITVPFNVNWTGFGAGWQAHLEALERVATGRAAGEAADWWERYRELRPEYERAAEALTAD